MPKVYAIDGVVPVVAPSAFVHQTAVLIGDVIVGADCYVGPGASLELVEALTEPSGARLKIQGSRPLHTIARDGAGEGTASTRRR
jgi:carbonic anhydrase/acetyltransferase-like protein (isoleucine patch superfamily)